MFNRTTLVSVLAAAVTTVALAGCGGATTTAPAASGGMPSMSGSMPDSMAQAAGAEHNDADITFATGMIPHHAQAVEMAKMAAGQASSAQVKDLAAKIEQAQGPEITQLQGFLSAWGQPAASTSSMGGMAGMGGAMPGMMGDQQMQQLQAASGQAFDRMWLQMMVEHHTGAIEMARTELASGGDADAKALAQKIIDGQQGEITTMKSLASA